MSTALASLSEQLQTKVKSWVKDSSASEETMIGRFKQQGLMKLLTAYVGKAIPFSTRNHFRVLACAPGYVKAEIALKPNINHFNAMYAGALFTVAELPGGILTLVNMDDRLFPILTDFTMQFKKPAKSDVTVEFRLSAAELKRIEKEAFETGKSEFSLTGELKDKEGNIVATSRGDYQVRPKRT